MFIGIDLHKKFLQIAIMDDTDKEVSQKDKVDTFVSQLSNILTTHFPCFHLLKSGYFVPDLPSYQITIQYHICYFCNIGILSHGQTAQFPCSFRWGCANFKGSR